MARKIYKLLFVTAAVVCGVCLFGLYGCYQIYQKARAEYDSLGQQVVVMRVDEDALSADRSSAREINQENAANQAESVESPPALLVDFDCLQAINKDAAAWIDFPGQGVSYPVAAGDDNEYYLNHTFQGRENSAGCIFADYRNSGILMDDNTILYGHNMKNGSMFGMLNRYEKESHYKKYPYFDIYVPEGTYRCRIIAVCRTEADGENFPVKFGTAEERGTFVKKLMAGTPYEMASDWTLSGEPGPLVMLSTCVGKDYEHRMVILAQAYRWE